MNWAARFKGVYINAIEMENKTPTLTIRAVESCELEDDDTEDEGRKKKARHRAVIWFKEIDRGWVFAKTAGYCMAAMWGEDDAAWAGKRVTLHAEMVRVGRDMEPGIRVLGSPDLKEPLQVKIKLPKRKAFTVKLMPTGQPQPQAQTA